MKKILILLTILMMIAALTGCGSKKKEQTDKESSFPSSSSELISAPESSKEPSSEVSSEPSSKPSAEPSSEVSSELSSSSSEPESSVPPESSSEESGGSGEVTVFDPETQTSSQESVEPDDDLDAALIRALNDALGFDGYEIKVNSVTLENGGLTIDLAGDSMPLVGVGSGGEAACLRSIAVTFMKNYPEAELVYFTVDGGIYSSGHLEFAPGEPYMDRSMMD